MPLVTPRLEEIVNSIANTKFLRATENEANIALDRLELEGLFVCIYNNLPEVDNALGEAGQFTVRNWPISVQVAQLADLDDNEAQNDAIRAACIPIADAIFNKWLTGIPQSAIMSPETYKIQIAEEVKVYDKILTGVRLDFDAKIDVLAYECD